MKKILNSLLMAALVCGLSLSVTSCKSDDDSDGSEQMDIEGLSMLENDQLADLIAAWTDTSRDDLNGTEWLNNQYEPTVGLALDESNPGIRRIAAGTIEEADSIAAGMLGTLGIDYEKPAGFTYSNSQVGTVEYSHGEGNTLGSISVNIRQIPVLQEIRFVKDLGENASGKPYYKCGDIVKYKNRFYVCVSKHKYGQEARFVTLNDQDSHSRGKFTWIGVGTDSVYNDDMAKAEVLGDWLQNVVCSGTMWNSVVSRMKSTKNGNYIRQVVPENEIIRVSFVNRLIWEDGFIPELQELNPLTPEDPRYSALAYGWREDDETERARLAPVGFLLADKLRYTMVGKYDKWVPYIFLAKGKKTFDTVTDLELHKIPSQYKDPSHFKFKSLNQFKITDTDQLIGLSTFNDTPGKSTTNAIKADTYYVCVIGMHWTHKRFYTGEIIDTNYKTLFSFVSDYIYNPIKKGREHALQHPENWIFRNITSRSLTYTDKGNKNKNYTDVSIQK